MWGPSVVTGPSSGAVLSIGGTPSWCSAPLGGSSWRASSLPLWCALGGLGGGSSQQSGRRPVPRELPSLGVPSEGLRLLGKPPLPVGLRQPI